MAPVKRDGDQVADEEAPGPGAQVDLNRRVARRAECQHRGEQLAVGPGGADQRVDGKQSDPCGLPRHLEQAGEPAVLDQIVADPGDEAGDQPGPAFDQGAFRQIPFPSPITNRSHRAKSRCARANVSRLRSTRTDRGTRVTYQVHIIGGGLAGSEAAWQLAKRGVRVRLSEMRGGVDTTPAHQGAGLAELVCSNSFRSDDDVNNAVGLLHHEMRACDSLVMAAAEVAKVPAGSALAVDRDVFSAEVEKRL